MGFNAICLQSSISALASPVLRSSSLAVPSLELSRKLLLSLLASPSLSPVQVELMLEFMLCQMFVMWIFNGPAKESPLPPHEPAVVGRAVNHFLQKHDSDLTIIDVRRVPSDFHARFKAQERTYFYRLLSGPEPLSTFEKDRAWHVCEDLNVPAMQEACRVLVGCHDFSSFRAAGCQAKSPIRTLDELSVTEVIESPYFPSVMDRERHNKVSSNLRVYPSNSGTDISPSSSPCIDKLTTSSEDVGFGKRRRHRCLVVTARARSFLYHQVRLLVGVLKAVGSGNLTIPDVERILNAKSVTSASPMAPACGLYLGEVKYDLPTT
ncbi:uncharacterized protein LOC108324839 isoform X3 [Vigna angularis]|uniref:uncharacterized protein LOC108324839 isoform X3 n=1 Tax=Phaseolus angularis TaxID=3914 RepID=UPI00080A4D4F|nr:uncharacterized protein LOC108324839 isoform X3 [Vigna angularis]